MALSLRFPNGDIEQNDDEPDGDNVTDSSDAIAGSNSGHVVNFASAADSGETEPTLDGFTVTAGDASNAAGFNEGGGLYLQGGASPTLRNLRVIGNRGNFGAAIQLLAGAAPTVTNVVLAGHQDGTESVSKSVKVSITPQSAGLSAPSPNPFSAEATLDLVVPQAQEVRVSVYDMLGREVVTLHEGTVAPEEPVPLTLNREALQTSGLYLIRAEGKTFTETRKVTLVR